MFAAGSIIIIVVGFTSHVYGFGQVQVIIAQGGTAVAVGSHIAVGIIAVGARTAFDPGIVATGIGKGAEPVASVAVGEVINGTACPPTPV